MSTASALRLANRETAMRIKCWKCEKEFQFKPPAKDPAKIPCPSCGANNNERRARPLR
jgi:rRNA maturation endonuclease Nob1